MSNAIGTIRQFTADDDAALTAAALRFAERHGLSLELDERPWQALRHKLWARPTTWSDTKQLRRLCQACLCRALRVPVQANITVAYGHVGYRVA